MTDVLNAFLISEVVSDFLSRDFSAQIKVREMQRSGEPAGFNMNGRRILAVFQNPNVFLSAHF